MRGELLLKKGSVRGELLKRLWTETETETEKCIHNSSRGMPKKSIFPEQSCHTQTTPAQKPAGPTTGTRTTTLKSTLEQRSLSRPTNPHPPAARTEPRGEQNRTKVQHKKKPPPATELHNRTRHRPRAQSSDRSKPTKRPRPDLLGDDDPPPLPEHRGAPAP